MKKSLLILVFCALASFAARACPFCGCGNSNFQIGLVPNFNKGFVGVRYTYSSFKTDSGSQFSRDRFHVTELWGGYNFGKVQVMAFVPYVAIDKLGDDGPRQARGLGDITVLGLYEVLNTSSGPLTDKAVIVRNQLWAGGGVKLGTGRSTVDVSDPAFTVGEFSGTPGTGSTDVLFNLNHTLLVNKHGLVTNLAYRLNTASGQNYRYGNRFYANSAYFYGWKVGKLDVRPTAGLNFVVNGRNRFEDQPIADSNGYVLNGTVGLNLQTGKVGLLVNGFRPLSQNLFNGLTKLNDRVSVALTLSI